MSQPAKGQEPSMEEILASIRRIIAEDPAKPPHSDGLRSEHVQPGSTRIVGGRDSLRRLPENQAVSGTASRLDTPAARIPPSDTGEDNRAFPQAQGPGSQPSRMLPDLPPAPTFGRAAASPVSAPAPESMMQQEEIEAFLTELGSSSHEATEEVGGSTEEIPLTDALPEPELTPLDHAAEITDNEHEEEPVELGPDPEPEPEYEAQPPGFSQRRTASHLPHRDTREQPRYAQQPQRLELAEEALISASATAAVNSAFNTLAQTVLVQNGRTLEDLVREMLRPMLKTWLDDNLPGMVERLVRAEIERVSRGRG